MEKEERKRTKIPVVFASDGNYLFYTCVAIASMAQKAKKGTIYQIYVLAANDFEDKDWMDAVQQKYANIHIEVVRVDDSLFQNVKINNSHMTKATFYRLVLCDLIKEEKCLYLDSDVIVTEDLGALYETELGNYYLAGCRDLWMDLLSEEEREKRRVKTRIPSWRHYVNAGVLLFNLKQIKEDGMDKVFMGQLDQDYPHEDHVCCYGKIMHLPAKWNLFTVFMGQMEKMKEAGIEEKVLEDFRKKSGILHYATVQARPWERVNCWLGREWWQVAKVWEGKAAYRKIKADVCRKEQERDWDYYRKLCMENRRIVIWGYTKYGEELCDWIIKMDEPPEVILGDNDERKQGLQYRGIPVVSFQEALRWGQGQDDLLFFIVSQAREEEVRKYLMEKGIHKDKMVNYRRKDENYYLYLDERFYRKELMEICRKENQDWNVLEPLGMDGISDKIINDRRFEEWAGKYYMDRWLLKGEWQKRTWR